MINTAIVVTDVQIAVKANRYANEGFYFCAMGSAYPKVKFDTIVFSCVLSTEVLQKWAKNFIKTSLKVDGKICGFATSTEVTGAIEVLEKVLEKIDPENDPEAILAETEAKQTEEILSKSEIDTPLPETKDTYAKTISTKKLSKKLAARTKRKTKRSYKK